MKATKYFFLSLMVFAMTFAAAPRSQAQVSFGLSIGAAPVCPYGYFSYRPYRCAPYGYYGPEWFNGGVFLGAGPWFHGPRGFDGHVNRRFDPRYGYRGRYPQRGEHFDRSRDFHDFHGNAYHNGHGYVGHGGQGGHASHGGGHAAHGGGHAAHGGGHAEHGGGHADHGNGHNDHH